MLEKLEIILKVNYPSDDEINSIKDKSILIGQFDSPSNKEIINKLKLLQPFTDKPLYVILKII